MEEVFNKYTIQTKEHKTGWVVTVINNNSKKLYNSIVYCYSFKSQESMDKWIAGFKENVNAWEMKKIARREERKNTPRNTEITSVVKKVLAGKYGFKNVQVRRGKGTAYGWVEARIVVAKPECSNHETNYSGCECSKVWRSTREQAEEIAYKAVKEAGLSFGHFYSDDGYNSQHAEFLLDVRYA